MFLFVLPQLKTERINKQLQYRNVLRIIVKVLMKNEGTALLSKEDNKCYW